MKLTYSVLVFFILFSGVLTAQERTITGNVSDEMGPLPGVSVLIKGTTSGTETDFDGNYSINANTGDILVYSFIGMATQERVVGNAGVINVVLVADNVLEEVVVVGYGTTTKKAYAGTAASIDTENLEAKNFSNVSQALTGEVSGVTVINSSGQPGAVGTIRVRGYGSPLGNRAPLYVVDGVPLTTAAVDEDGLNIDTGILNNINPADIQSTTVLKDATATAIYGSRGANGVVLITTKSGSSGKTSIEVDVKTGINNQIIPRYDVIKNPEQYIGLVWEGLYNRGVATGNADPVGFANSTLLTDNGIGDGYNMWNASTGADLIDPTTRTVRNGVQRLFTPERYADEAFGTGFRTEANVRISGGNEKSRHFFSMGYLDDKGYSINSDFKRYSARLNSTTNIKEWLKVGANLGYTLSKSTNNGQIIGSENVFEQADKMAPIYPVFARFPNTGDLIPDPIFGGFQYDYGSPTGTTANPTFTRNRPNANLLNPIGSAMFDFDGTDTHAVTGNISFDVKFTDWLSLETKFGGQYSAARNDSYTNSVYGTGRNTNGIITVRDRILWSLSTLQLLRFRKSFDNHTIEALAAHETYEESFTQSRQFMQNVITPGVYNLGNFLESTSPPDGFEDASGLESYFGQVNYNYDNKYFITGSLRTDGSSRFVNEQWGTFGSVGAAWIASEEDFLSDSLISYLKLKASWGVTGDQQGVATTLGFNTFIASFVGGSLAISENRTGDANLTWETTEQLQGGIELSLGNWLDANFDYYRKTTDALFFDARRGPSSGISSIRVNDGEVLNAGFEFDVTGHIINKEDFSLDVSINGEILDNEMLSMPLDPSTGTPRVLDSGTSLDGNYAYVEGGSIFDFWMREWAGVDPADGAPMWYQYYDDANNNNVLDTGEGSFAVDDGNGGDANTSGSLFEYRQLVPGANIQKTVTKTFANGTQVFLNKSFIPDVRGAFRISGRFKNFDFSTQFTYSLGGYAYDAQYAELMSDRFGAAGNNFHTDILNRWQQPGDITDVPLLSDNAIVNSTNTSSRFVMSTDYLTLNNARIGYTMPSKFINKVGFDALNLWVSGDNLFTETAREGFNPAVREVGSSERRIYAPATTITLGVRVKF